METVILLNDSSQHCSDTVIPTHRYICIVHIYVVNELHDLAESSLLSFKRFRTLRFS